MGIDLDNPTLYINRELSWLRFNSRVLDQVNFDEYLPLDKLKFIAIYGTNLDEFYMIRVAGLKSLYKAGIYDTGPDKLPPKVQLELIREYIRKEIKVLESSYLKVLSELEANELYIKRYDEVNERVKEELNKHFFDHIYPIIIPIAVDTTHPFPHLNNLSFAIAVALKSKEGHIKYGLIRIPRILPRFFKVDNIFVPVESIVQNFINELFVGYEVIISTPFRVTRNADIEIEEEEADDFLEMLEEGLRSRNRGAIVRLELNGGADESLVEFLCHNLKIDRDDVYYYENIPLNLGSFWQIVNDKDFAHLLSKSFIPKTLPPLDREDIYNVIEKEDILLYHPYESFEPVIKFIKEAANDPQTLAIRMVLYRVGKNSPIVRSLIDAVRNGKQVTVMVELKARFDEENNLKWAKQLESAGAHVVYGIPGFKVHAKIAQVIKYKDNKLKGYLHLSTGNYNPTTAKIYTDVSFFTTNKGFNSDATKFFHYLTGYAAQKKLDYLYMSPTQIKPKLLKLIEKEASLKEEGRIILKANSLVDQTIIKALYKASMAGVKIDLIIRGICCLRPQVKGVSENINVHSIIGKYLEHARIYWFKNDTTKAYISSADLMPRNLDRRIELMAPIEDEKLKEKLYQILKIQLLDNTHRYILQSNGEYIRVTPKEGEKVINSQEAYERYVTQLSKLSQKSSKHFSKFAKKILKDK
ncbi:MAG: RNA degradosome polyphosphate kinase [Epsilonproteobacteria bacterium]|nr:RNA degradosome polyphosphate kinase [Campylobacterota bacterium]